MLKSFDVSVRPPIPDYDLPIWLHRIDRVSQGTVDNSCVQTYEANLTSFITMCLSTSVIGCELNPKISKPDTIERRFRYEAETRAARRLMCSTDVLNAHLVPEVKIYVIVPLKGLEGISCDYSKSARSVRR